MPTVPPFASLSDFASALASLVSDDRGGQADSDFVVMALQSYAESHPRWVVVDVGDGTTKAWPLGTDPFDEWVPGFSGQYSVGVEQLSSGSPQSPRVDLRPGTAWRIEPRVSGGSVVDHLVFEDAPTVADQVRVRFRASYTVTDAPLNNVPVAHQLAVVYRAAAYKCTALASAYRKTVDAVGGSDLFDGLATADAYERDARKWLADYRRTIGAGPQHGFSSGRVSENRARVFPRGSAL